MFYAVTNFPNFSQQADKFNDYIGIADEAKSIGSIVSTTLPYILTIGGLVLLVMLISGGITMMTSVADAKSAEAGKQRITQALIGFFILFATYWIFQILETILGINILTGNGSPSNYIQPGPGPY